MLCQPLSPTVSIGYIQCLGYVHSLFGTPISQLAIRRANGLELTRTRGNEATNHASGVGCNPMLNGTIDYSEYYFSINGIKSSLRYCADE